jgi:hypothetical protein
LRRYRKEIISLTWKIIRSGDQTVMAINQEYKKGKDPKNKSQLIHKLVSFAEEKATGTFFLYFSRVV